MTHVTISQCGQRCGIKIKNEFGTVLTLNHLMIGADTRNNSMDVVADSLVRTIRHVLEGIHDYHCTMRVPDIVLSIECDLPDLEQELYAKTAEIIFMVRKLLSSDYLLEGEDD